MLKKIGYTYAKQYVERIDEDVNEILGFYADVNDISAIYWCNINRETVVSFKSGNMVHVKESPNMIMKNIDCLKRY